MWIRFPIELNQFTWFTPQISLALRPLVLDVIFNIDKLSTSSQCHIYFLVCQGMLLTLSWVLSGKGRYLNINICINNQQCHMMLLGSLPPLSPSNSWEPSWERCTSAHTNLHATIMLLETLYLVLTSLTNLALNVCQEQWVLMCIASPSPTCLFLLPL